MSTTIDNIKTLYYNVRNKFNEQVLNETEQAACMIFLNKTGFNGLYRVNHKNELNVAWGKHYNPAFPAKDDLKAIAKVLEKTEISNEDFEDVEYKQSDLVYFDPPYHPLTGNFTGYTQNAFSWDDQIRLKELIKKLDKLGISFIMSNSNFFEIKQWFPLDWIKMVDVRRSISQDGANRNNAREVIVSNRWLA